MNSHYRTLTLIALTTALVAVAGCGKKSAPLPPAEIAPAAITAPAPTVQLTATPTVIAAGDQVQLKWQTMDATSVSIDALGDVPTSGVKTVTPSVSTTYHLVAKGAGGTSETSVRVTVNAPPAVEVPTSTISTAQDFKNNVQDVFFNYDDYDVRADAEAVLSRDAAYLVIHPGVRVVIGGYCDERGSNEYNLALGQNRADAAKKALVAAGVSPSRIRVVSYGKEKPFCSESTEECWQQNRRAGFTMEP